MGIGWEEWLKLLREGDRERPPGCSGIGTFLKEVMRKLLDICGEEFQANGEECCLTVELVGGGGREVGVCRARQRKIAQVVEVTVVIVMVKVIMVVMVMMVMGVVVMVEVMMMVMVVVMVMMEAIVVMMALPCTHLCN
jgi:hypothetical protein